MKLQLRPLTRESMAGFGVVIEAPTVAGERSYYTDWLVSEREGTTLRLHVNLVEASSFPFAVAKLERHAYSSQAFMPLDVAGYVVLVASSLKDGRPDVGSARAFVAPGNVGVIYGPGVWHAGAAVLERAGSFQVLMWRNDTGDDDEFIGLDVPLEVCW